MLHKRVVFYLHVDLALFYFQDRDVNRGGFFLGWILPRAHTDVKFLFKFKIPIKSKFGAVLHIQVEEVLAIY